MLVDGAVAGLGAVLEEMYREGLLSAPSSSTTATTATIDGVSLYLCTQRAVGEAGKRGVVGLVVGLVRGGDRQWVDSDDSHHHRHHHHHHQSHSIEYTFVPTGPPSYPYKVGRWSACQVFIDEATCVNLVVRAIAWNGGELLCSIPANPLRHLADIDALCFSCC